jgi:hypothetical protein
LLIGYLWVGGELVIDALLVDLLQAGLSDGLLELERRISSAAALTGLDVTLNAGHGGLGVLDRSLLLLDLRPVRHPAVSGGSGDRGRIHRLSGSSNGVVYGGGTLHSSGNGLVDLIHYRLGGGDFSGESGFDHLQLTEELGVCCTSTNIHGRRRR